MKTKLKALLPLLFVIALLTVLPFVVNAEECENHNIIHVEAQSPTCHTEGNTEYWYCTECECFWADEELILRTNYRLTRIEPSEDVDLIFVPLKDPTCSEAGMKEHWFCPECGIIRLDPNGIEVTRPFVEIPTIEHTIVHVEAQEPSCHSDGNIEYWHCDKCNLYWAFEDLSVRITNPNLSTVLKAHGHDYVDGVCTRCGDVDAPVVSVDGLHMTVSGLKGVKDYFIAKGNYNTYRELKPYYVMRVTPAKINGANEYTYTLKEAGEYTVCVRFEDPSKENLILYATVDVPTPEISVNGLSATLSGLEGIRVIRTAPGEWNTPGEVKRAAGARNIAARSIGSDPYVIKYSDPGVYTVTLEYYNGLVVVETVEITRREPTMVRDGNTLTFGDLDGLYVIRYAPGEFTYAGDIKRAEGAKFIRPSAIDENGEISFEIGDGVYTVCVQYNDGSYNYYVVDNKVSILEKYGLTYNVHIWRNEMPSTGPVFVTNLAVQFETVDESELPDMVVSAKIESSNNILLFEQSDRKGCYRLPTQMQIDDLRWNLIVEGRDTTEIDDMEFERMYIDDILEAQKGEDVKIEITVTIDGVSESFVVNSFYGVVC